MKASYNVKDGRAWLIFFFYFMLVQYVKIIMKKLVGW